ncbi:MAG: potassium-transporting ATPase subunit KdpA [Syntrophorhabdus sp.]
MDIYGWLQLIVFVSLVIAVTRPMGIYLSHVLDPDAQSFLNPVAAPLERFLYRLFCLQEAKEQTWREYTFSLLVFSCLSLIFSYAILRLQHILPLNPRGLGPVAPELSFNTAVSFATNTNWQNYSGESTMSYLSQMVALTFQNFVSASCGIAVSATLVRAIARQKARTVGNFWVDLIRINVYLLLPLSLVFSLFLVSQGVIQNFKPYVSSRAVEPVAVLAPQKDETGAGKKDAMGNAVMTGLTASGQSIVQGPIASQVAIKILGTNGGGYTNANAAHPYENPTPLSNLLQIFSIFLIPAGLTYYLGIALKNHRHGWSIFTVMLILFLAGMVLCWFAEGMGNPRMHHIGVSAAQGNMEGKEVRFGVFGSALFATVTTDASCGAVNAMHDSFTPLGGLVPLVNIQLGEVVFGGVGSGLYGMLVFVILAIFLAGLMVGRTPEYCGKKIEAYDVKMCALVILVSMLSILGFAAFGAETKWGTSALGNAGPHGLSEIIYAFSSAVGNNGSAFAGLSGNTAWYNITLGLAMLFGRFLIIVPVMALAGNLAMKRMTPVNSGSFPVWGVMFVILIIGTILIVGALTFLPALALGPVVEHYLMHYSTVLY